MGAPLVGQERLADSRNIARAVEMQQEIRRLQIPRRDVGRDRRRQRHAGADGGGASWHPRGRCRLHGARLSRGADDVSRDRRLTTLPLHAVRSARHRGHRHQGAELEMDGAGQPQDLRRDGFDRLHQQGAAHRPRSQGLGHSFHHHRGDPDRPRWCAKPTAPMPTRSRPCSTAKAASASSPARWSTSPAAPPKDSCAAQCAVEGTDADRGIAAGALVPERVDRGLARGRGDRDVSGPDLRARQRLGPRGRHRDHPLRPARHRGGAAGARRC